MTEDTEYTKKREFGVSPGITMLQFQRSHLAGEWQNPLEVLPTTLHTLHDIHVDRGETLDQTGGFGRLVPQLSAYNISFLIGCCGILSE